MSEILWKGAEEEGEEGPRRRGEASGDVWFASLNVHRQQGVEIFLRPRLLAAGVVPHDESDDWRRRKTSEEEGWGARRAPARRQKLGARREKTDDDELELGVSLLVLLEIPVGDGGEETEKNGGRTGRSRAVGDGRENGGKEGISIERR
eukprot:750627-Hanusia_phi.AAC.3